jgi:hypothetical protein
VALAGLGLKRRGIFGRKTPKVTGDCSKLHEEVYIMSATPRQIYEDDRIGDGMRRACSTYEIAGMHSNFWCENLKHVGVDGSNILMYI